MTDEEIIELLNRGYGCLPRVWPAAESGDQAAKIEWLLNHSLALTPDQRLSEHQEICDFLVRGSLWVEESIDEQAARRPPEFE